MRAPHVQTARIQTRFGQIREAEHVVQGHEGDKPRASGEGRRCDAGEPAQLRIARRGEVQVEPDGIDVQASRLPHDVDRQKRTSERPASDDVRRRRCLGQRARQTVGQDVDPLDPFAELEVFDQVPAVLAQRARTGRIGGNEREPELPGVTLQGNRTTIDTTTSVASGLKLVAASICTRFRRVTPPPAVTPTSVLERPVLNRKFRR